MQPNNRSKSGSKSTSDSELTTSVNSLVSPPESIDLMEAVDAAPVSADGSQPKQGLALNSSIQLEHRLPKIIPFDSLTRCGDEIWIENNGQIYRLRRTRQGKLILTK